MALGDAYIDVHANTEPFDDELRDGVDKSAERNEREFKKTGEKVGDAVGEGMGDSLEKQGPHLAKQVEKGLSKTKIRSKVTIQYDRDNNVVRRWVTETSETITNEIQRAFAPGGGPARAIGRVFSDAIGAGFNVSGRSGLILLLIPIIGLIGAAIGALVEALVPLVAIIAALPSALAGLSIQAATLFVVFQGLGERIKAAFEAKNAKELKEALKGLGPATQDFIKQLLPLEKFWKDLKKRVQEAFFVGLGPNIIKQLQPLLNLTKTEMPKLAKQLGETLGVILKVFDHPAVVKFFKNLSESTGEWLKGFGPAFGDFLVGLFTFMDKILPFLSRLGAYLNNKFFREFGKWLKSTAEDPGFSEWLDKAFQILVEVFDFIGALIKFAGVFTDALTEAEGPSFLASLTEALNKFTEYLKSPEGKKAMDGLVHSLTMLAQAAFILIFAFFQLLAIGEEVGEFFNTTFPNATLKAVEEIKRAWNDMVEDLKFVWDDFVSDLKGAWEELKQGWKEFTAELAENWNAFVEFAKQVWGSVPLAIASAIAWLLGKWDEFTTGVSLKIAFVTGKIKGIKDTIIAFFTGAAGWLREAGRNLVRGLIEGITDKLRDLRDAAGILAAVMAGAIPGSPAEYGPFSGRGAPELRGQRIAQDIAAGMIAGTPALRSASMVATSNIVFGAGSVQATFNGQLPTNGQATSLGSALGAGISNQIAMRNTRLAVRTL